MHAPAAQQIMHHHAYAELAVTSNFTFLTGASHPDELVDQGAVLGYSAIAITDTNTLAGVVRAHVAAKERGIQLLVGVRLVLEDAESLSLLMYPTDRASYSALCRLLTFGKRRADKGQCRLRLHDVIEHQQDMLCVIVTHGRLDQRCVETVEGLRRVFNRDRLSLSVSKAYAQSDDLRVQQLDAMSVYTRVPLVITGDVQYHIPERRALHDVLTCIRHGCTIEQGGRRLLANAERHLKPPGEIARMFRLHDWCEKAMARSVEIAQRAAGFSLDQLRYEYPDEVVPEGTTAQSHLTDLTWQGARERYPRGVPDKVKAQIEHELRLISELSYAPYFLTVHDIVRFARSRSILCQGRGAAANSAVCYCLGVTAVDPDRVNVLFERFVSKERDEPPDIDIDFEHERREEVIQYLYQKYGRSRAALTAEVICFRARLAVREVGKAMGLSGDLVDRLAREVEWWDHGPTTPERLRELGLDPRDPHLARTMALAAELVGFPRHLSQHVGGFVITRSALDELVPIENAAMVDRTVIEWNKDDIEALNMLKVDVLGLGMLTCVHKTLEMVGQYEGRTLGLTDIPPEDPQVYDMICKADTVGVFQIESRAQMSMLPRLRPRCYYDLVIEVAIVRPGPIQGNMVHPYLRRRNGEEPVCYLDERVKSVLGRTLGVPLFQEQAMSLAVVAAGFTPGEADQLRRAIGAWKARGNKLALFGERIIKGMMNNGYPRQFAEQCFEQIKGFSGYGFPESHAASFALIVYSSSWLKRHKPAAFAACLINSQPMGFYQPAQIIRDAREHGVEVRPIDVNHSSWDCTLEQRENGEPAIRLGMRLVSGLKEAEAVKISACAQRQGGRVRDIATLRRLSGASAATLRKLGEADAYGSMGITRRAALWAIQKLSDEAMPLFEDVLARERIEAEPLYLPRATPVGETSADYRAAGLTLRTHPVKFVRDVLASDRVIENQQLSDGGVSPNGRRVQVAGLVLVRQRPGTASGVLFMTIEDETGIANIVVWPKVYERYRRAIRHSTAVVCSGSVQRQGEVVHVIARRVRSLKLDSVGGLVQSRDFH